MLIFLLWLWRFLSGKKTYIIAVAIGVTASLQYLGVINEMVGNAIFVLLTGGGLAALRHGVEHAAEEVKETVYERPAVIPPIDDDEFAEDLESIGEAPGDEDYNVAGTLRFRRRK